MKKQRQLSNKVKNDVEICPKIIQKLKGKTDEKLENKVLYSIKKFLLIFL